MPCQLFETPWNRWMNLIVSFIRKNFEIINKFVCVVTRILRFFPFLSKCNCRNFWDSEIAAFTKIGGMLKIIDEYWRLWNAPVHFWLKRHVYIPLRFRIFPFVSSLVIFGLSAIGHEYLVAVSTHLPLGWALGAMLIQIPLITITRWYFRSMAQIIFPVITFLITFASSECQLCTTSLSSFGFKKRG